MVNHSLSSNRREIATKWRCQQDGACCREPHAVTVSHAEAAMLTLAAPDVDLFFAEVKPGFYEMQAGPCPLLTDDGQCSVYEVRPYNCRRFQCLRPDVSLEPFELAADGSCTNLTERVEQSLHALEFYRTNQRHAQRTWGEAHGWSR